MGTVIKLDDVDALEATSLRNNLWAVRPKGAVGMVGWSPRPWSVYFTKARSEREALHKARGKVFSK